MSRVNGRDQEETFRLREQEPEQPRPLSLRPFRRHRMEGTLDLLVGVAHPEGRVPHLG